MMRILLLTLAGAALLAGTAAGQRVTVEIGPGAGQGSTCTITNTETFTDSRSSRDRKRCVLVFDLRFRCEGGSGTATNIWGVMRLWQDSTGVVVDDRLPRAYCRVSRLALWRGHERGRVTAAARRLPGPSTPSYGRVYRTSGSVLVSPAVSSGPVA